MPFLLPILGLFGITAAIFGGERLADNIPVPPPQDHNPGTPLIPWYIPVVAVAIGGVLIYKYGAKKLHV